jgi:hypothetical protein
VHTRAASTAHQIVEVAHENFLAALAGGSDEQILERKIHTLGEGRGANHELREALLHRMLDCKPKAMRCVGMVRKDSKRSCLGGYRGGTKLELAEGTKLFDLGGVREGDRTIKRYAAAEDVDGTPTHLGNAVFAPAKDRDATVADDM